MTLYRLSSCQRNQNMSIISEGYSIKCWFSRTQKNSSIGGLAEKESDWLIFYRKIDHTTKKAVTKVFHKKFHWGIDIKTTYNINKLWDFHWE